MKVIRIPVLEPPASRTVLILDRAGVWTGGAPPLNRSSPVAELGWLCAGRVGKQKSKGEPVRFDPPSLRVIHSAGISVDHTVCRAFEPYRRLLNGQEKHNFVGLWREHNKLVAIYQGDERWWQEHPEYLDPSDPLRLDREIYELEGLGEALKQGDPLKIILVHHQIRQALAREQFLESGLGWHALSIPFTLVAEDEKEPFLRDGIIPISLPPIERVIGYFEAVIEPLEPGTHDLYRETLIKREVARRYREGRGWRCSLMGSRRLAILYPDLSVTRIEVLEAIHRSLPHEGAGDEILKVLPERSDFLTFLKAAAGLLELPPRSLAAQLGTAEERWKPGIPAGLKWLPAVVRVLNLLHLPQPWEVLYRLYREELDWGFRVERNADGLLVFATRDRIDREDLITGGLGNLLNPARIDRSLHWKKLAPRVARNLGHPISWYHLAGVAANDRRSSFPLLRALVATLNEGNTTALVDPGLALLATHPTLLNLLPLISEGVEGPVVIPVGPFREIAPAEPRRSQVIAPQREVTLDSDGFPHLIRTARIRRGWNRVKACRELGLPVSHYKLFERDPGERSKSSRNPGRTILRTAVLPAGLAIPMDTIIEAHTHTYWPEDPAVRVLTERTFGSPTFLDGYSRTLFTRAAALSFQTPAEILYWWRNSVGEPVREGRLPFLPTQQEFSEFLAIGRSTYKLWEQLQAVPSDERAARIADRLGRPAKEKTAFLEACRRMREHLISEDS